MGRKQPSVWVVDDDPDVLDAVTMLLRAAGFDPVPCASGREALERIEPGVPGCVLLDLRMPRMGGLEVQRELRNRGCLQPVVFLSGHGDIPVAVRAVQAGALDFLEKPVRDHLLVETVKGAIAVDTSRRRAERARSTIVRKVESLSPREAQVAELVAQGLRTADIAEKLGLSARTVDMHRARLLRRVGARTSAEAASMLRSAELTRKKR